MKAALIALFLVASTATTAYSCTCFGDAAKPTCKQVNASKAMFFVGKVEHIGFKTELLPPDDHPFKMQVVTFTVLDIFGSGSDATLTVTDWPPGNGSCGYPFSEGKTYLVDSLRGNGDSLRLRDCGYTAETSGAAEVVGVVRSCRASRKSRR